jgi:hypothetical protein
MFGENIRKHVSGKNIRKHVRKEHSELRDMLTGNIRNNVREKHSEHVPNMSKKIFENMFPEKSSGKTSGTDIRKKSGNMFGTC